MRTQDQRSYVATAFAVLAAASVATQVTASASPGGVFGHRADPIVSATPIQHVVVIMEEKHSFDNYFGTFPAANGIRQGVCVPDPATKGCDARYHEPNGFINDLPHNVGAAKADIDQGKMDGFVKVEQKQCTCSRHDSMAWFDATDIPIFWRLNRPGRGVDPPAPSDAGLLVTKCGLEPRLKGQRRRSDPHLSRWPS